MTFDNAYNLFLAHAIADRAYAPETLVKLKDCFRNWLAPFLKAVELQGLSFLEVTSLRTAMLQKRLSVSRQYAVLMWLRMFLKFCRSHLQLEVLDPSAIALPARPAPIVSFLTNSDIDRVLSAIPMNTYSGKRLRALIELLLGTGLRISEALSLDRRHFDDRQPEIDIVGKGGVRRKVFISARAFRWVSLYLGHRRDHCPALFVTTGNQPTRVARADISRFFIRLRKQAGIDKPLTPHVLRHTYCTTLLNNGVDITFIRDLAGHRDISTTARYYLGVDDKKLRDLVDTRLNYGPPEHAAP